VKQDLQIAQSIPEQAAESKLNLSRWLGRHEALDMVARGCSAVDAACLKQIREEKLYLEAAPNWDRFCKKELNASRKKIDNVIRHLDEFGPGYFDLSRLTRVSVEEYRQLAPAVGVDGVQLNGEVVAIAPQNKEKLDAAVAEIRKNRAKPEVAKKSFRPVLDACSAALALIEKPPCWPNALDKLDLTAILLQTRKAAEGLGVITVNVRL
jgi:hypothetical protein